MITKNFINKNRSYISFIPKGVVLHETATAGATATDSRKYFNENDVDASAHCFVDWYGTIQFLPWNEKGWHAGATANSRFIGVEMCRPATHNEEQFNKVWRNTIWTLAFIFGQVLNIWDINEKTLTDHKTISETYKETDHVDPIDYLAEYGVTMEDVRNAVIKCMRDNVVDDLFPKEIVSVAELMEYKRKYEELAKKYDSLVGRIEYLLNNYKKEL